MADVWLVWIATDTPQKMSKQQADAFLAAGGWRGPYASRAAAVAGSSGGGGGGGGRAGSSGAFSYKQLEQLWTSAGGPARVAPVMAAIGMAESAGNPKAHNASGASGLWQILGNPFPGNPFDPSTNARMAVAKWRSQGLKAWESYTNGAYKKFLQGGASVVAHGAQAFLDEAGKFLGTPYVWGGASPKGFDCSGLVKFALEKIGIKNVPRTSEAQWAWVKKVSRKDLQPGDLVFLNFPGEAPPGHVMIWKGGNQVIQAPSTGQDVQVTDFDPDRTPKDWGAQLIGFGRVPGIGGGSFSGQPGQPGAGGQQVTLTDYTGGWESQIPVFGPALQWISDLGSLTGLPAVFGTFTNNLSRIEHGIEWFFVPNHWVRIFCGLFGTGFVIAGLITMTRTGRPYSVTVPEVGAVPAAGGELAPALGIAEVTAGAVLLFVAFHNLPPNVSDFPGLMSHLQQQVQTGGKAA